MRLIFAGTPEPAVPSLRRLIASPRHDIVAVISRPDAIAGRGRRITRSPVAIVADEHDIPVLTPANPNEPEFMAQVRDLAPDCCPVVAYGALLRASLLALPRHGWINLHFSLLPAWRGAAPVQAALAAGDEFTGAATFAIESGLDTGPVYGVLTERIRAADTAGELLGRLADAGANLLETTLDGVEAGALVPVAQDAEGVSYAPKVTVESARIRWEHPATAIDRHVRSVTPAPGAWTTIGDMRIKVGPVTVDDRVLAPGAVEATKAGVYIGTVTTAVRLNRVQPQGKKDMAAVDWARGARLGEALVAR